MIKSKTQKLRQLKLKIAFKSVKLKGKITQAISLNYATKQAIKLFKTPIKFKIPAREIPMYSNSIKEFVEIEELNKEIMVYRNGNADKKVILIHGWSGRGTQLYKINNMLLDMGFSTISFDAPAHGMSTGKNTMMNEFVICVRKLTELYGPFEYGIGHSLGGMALLNSIKSGISIKKAVCIGSGNSIYQIMKDFVNQLDLKPIIAEKMKAHYDKQFGVDLENFSSYNVAKSIEIPVFIIHDTNDKDVPVTCAYDIHSNLKNGKLLITNGLGHRKILGDSLVLDNIRNFIHA